MTLQTRQSLSLILFGILLSSRLGATDALSETSPPPSPTFERPANALFTDDFSSNNLKGWRTDSLANAWSVRSGQLCGDLPDSKQAHSFLFAGDSTWTDYALDFDVCGMRGVDKGVAVRVRKRDGLGFDLRGGEHNDVVVYLGKLPVGKGKVQNANGAWHHMRIEVRGRTFRVLVNGQLVEDKTLVLKAPPRSGGIVLAAYAGGVAQCTVYYDNVAVTPLAEKHADQK